MWVGKSLAVSAAAVARVLTRAIIGSKLYPITSAETTAGLTSSDLDLSYPVGNVRRYQAVGDGVANDTTPFTRARTVTGGRYHVPRGTYLVDAAPDVFADIFTADDDAAIKIGATTYDVSRAFAGPWRYVAGSATLLNIRHAKSGSTIMQLQDGGPGTATYFYRGLSFDTDSHFIQCAPATNGGSTDLLFQRSDANADAAGNRFNFTFDEANDRLLVSFATTASGFPSFDSAIQIYAGTSPSMVFPGLQPQFNQGWSIKQRSAGGFELEAVVDATTVRFRNKGTPANVNLILGDATIGFFGSAGGAKPTVTGSRGGNAALASLLTELAALGLITNSTTA